MQAPQARHIARGGTQDFSLRWQRERLSGKSPTIFFELQSVQCYHVPHGGASRCLVPPLAAAVEHDLAWPQFCPAPYRQWLRMCRKRYERELRPWTDIGNPRKVFLAPQHLQIVQLRPGQAGLELGA